MSTGVVRPHRGVMRDGHACCGSESLAHPLQTSCRRRACWRHRVPQQWYPPHPLVGCTLSSTGLHRLWRHCWAALQTVHGHEVETRQQGPAAAGGCGCRVRPATLGVPWPARSDWRRGGTAVGPTAAAAGQARRRWRGATSPQLLQMHRLCSCPAHGRCSVTRFLPLYTYSTHNTHSTQRGRSHVCYAFVRAMCATHARNYVSAVWCQCFDRAVRAGHAVHAVYAGNPHPQRLDRCG